MTRVLLMSIHAGADGQHFSSRNQRSTARAVFRRRRTCRPSPHLLNRYKVTHGILPHSFACFKVGFCRRLRKRIAAYYYDIVIMASMSSMSMAYNKAIRIIT